MAIPATSVGEVRTTADHADNAGFYDPAIGTPNMSTDYTLQNSAQVVIDGAAITATVHSDTTKVTIAGHTVDDGNEPGNFVRFTGGTLTAGLYCITAVDEANNRWTLDRSCGTAAQTGTGRMGGAMATPGRAAADMTVNGMKTWVKDGTYTITTTTPGTAGPVLFANNIAVEMEGYLTIRGDQGATPTLDAGAQTGVNLFSAQGTTGAQCFLCLKADGQAGASNVGFNLTNRATTLKCVAFDCVTGFLGNRSFARNCFADTCSTAGFTDVEPFGCDAKACTNGYTVTGVGYVGTRSIARSCITDGFVSTAGNDANWINCTSDGNGQYGFNFGTNRGTCTNCIASNHVGGGDAGYFTSASPAGVQLVNCAGYTNTTNASGTYQRNQGFITLTADPYVNQAGGDFRPNATPDGGASLLSAGIGVYGQTNNLDVGALQHSDMPVGRSLVIQNIGTY